MGMRDFEAKGEGAEKSERLSRGLPSEEYQLSLTGAEEPGTLAKHKPNHLEERSHVHCRRAGQRA